MIQYADLQAEIIEADLREQERIRRARIRLRVSDQMVTITEEATAEERALGPGEAARLKALARYAGLDDPDLWRALRVTGSAQEAQKALFELQVPLLVEVAGDWNQAGAEEEGSFLRGRAWVLGRLRDSVVPVPWSELAAGKTHEQAEGLERLLAAMEAEGLVRVEAAGSGRRYLLGTSPGPASAGLTT